MPGRIKIKDGSLKEAIKDNLIWIIGCILYSASVNIFSIPNQISQSGVTGISIVLNYLTGVPTGVMNFTLNIPLFVLAFIFLGKGLVIRSAWVTALLSFFIDAFRWVLPSAVYTGDKLLAAFICGITGGFGLALILVRGATSGGTDIIGKLFKKKFPYVSVGTVILAADVFVTALSYAVFGSVESALYAAVQIFVSTKTIDYVLYGADRAKLILAVTDKTDEITERITRDASRGISVIPVKGGYTGESKNMIMCAARKTEAAKIIRIIRKCDENCFIMIGEAGEIFGKGFKKFDG